MVYSSPVVHSQARSLVEKLGGGGGGGGGWGGVGWFLWGQVGPHVYYVAITCLVGGLGVAPQENFVTFYYRKTASGDF